MEKGVQSWKSVRSCSVEVEESAEEPTSFSETIVMTQVGDVVIESPSPHVEPNRTCSINSINRL